MLVDTHGGLIFGRLNGDLVPVTHSVVADRISDDERTFLREWQQ